MPTFATAAPVLEATCPVIAAFNEGLFSFHIRGSQRWRPGGSASDEADLVLYVAVLAGLRFALYFYSQHRRLERLVTMLIRREALSAARRGGSDPSDVSPE